MEASSVPSVPPSPSLLDRGAPASKNRLLNLAFEEFSHSHAAREDLHEPKSVPADVFKQGVREHAVMMGMQLPEDEQYLWIAEESLLAPLPEGWVQLKDDDSGHPYYCDQAESHLGLVHVVPPIPPEPSFPAPVVPAPKYDARGDDVGTRYEVGANEVDGDGDSACGEEFPSELTMVKETREAVPKETDRLRKQLEKAKDSRKVMAQQHDDTLAALERAKEDVEEKIDLVTEELRQERRRLKNVVLERDKSEKITSKLRETILQLEAKLDEGTEKAGELSCSLDDLREEAASYKRELAKANARADLDVERRDQELQQRWAEATRQSKHKMDDVRRSLLVEKQALSAETEQIRAKMDFQVDERVREAVDAYQRREKKLEEDLDALRRIGEKYKGKLAQANKDMAAAKAASNARVASEEDARRSDLFKQIEKLSQTLQEAEARSDALAADLTEKNKLIYTLPELQRATADAREGLRSANNRFDQEVMRMNADVINAEGALEKQTMECKKLESTLDDAEARVLKAETLAAAERKEVVRLSEVACSTEALLTESRSKVEALSRQLKYAQQSLNASEGLEQDLKRLGREAAEMNEEADRKLAEKQQEIELCRERLEEVDAETRHLKGSLAEAEARAHQQKDAADRYMERISSLEGALLEGRAALASVETSRSAVALELADAKEVVVIMGQQKEEMAEAKVREEALRVEIDAINKTLQGAETVMERERRTWGETKVDMQKQVEGAERRCESMQTFANGLQEQHRDMGHRYQQEIDKSKAREADMWAQLQQVSSSFAAVASSNKEGESILDAKLGCLEQRLMDARKQAQASQLECERVKEDAQRESTAKEVELKALRERISRKKDKFSTIKAALEEECQTLKRQLTEARAVEEGVRARCAEVVAREEDCQGHLSRLQEAKAAADQEVARACAEATGLKSHLEHVNCTHKAEAERLRAESDSLQLRMEAAMVKHDTDLRAAEGSKNEAEARCKVLRDTIDRLEDDLATLTAQLTEGNIGEHPRESDNLDSTYNDKVTGLKFKVLEAQEEIQKLSRSLTTSAEESSTLKGELRQAQARYAELEATSCQSRLDYNSLKAKSEAETHRVQLTQAEADQWRSRFETERTLRRALNAKVLDIQGNIRVLCRLRPLQQAEMKAIERDSEYEDPMTNISYPDDDRLSFWGVPYQFDCVFGPGTEQAKVFGEVQPVVASALDGHRVCVFAYGQTGSGKTYTMEGPRHDRGVNFRALGELFSLSRQEDGKEFQFRVSMLEVYNESIKDLLVVPGRPAAGANKHDVRLDKKGKVYVEGLVECEVETLEEVEELVVLGGRNRTVGNNNVNVHSSRSHLVLQVHITNTTVETGHVQHGKLNLIDLAGSERIKSTAAEGQQLKEAQNINRSLSALGDVINALGSSNKHVPYRNSKLTFLLQDSLSSNSKVLMFVNINPAPQSQGESMCSLNFAKRCRSVQLGTSRRIGAR